MKPSERTSQRGKERKKEEEEGRGVATIAVAAAAVARIILLWHYDKTLFRQPR